MPLPSTAVAAPTGASSAARADGTTCPSDGLDVSQAARAVFGELFPPRDADGERHRAWLARSSWPEVVFASVR